MSNKEKHSSEEELLRKETARKAANQTALPGTGAGKTEEIAENAEKPELTPAASVTVPEGEAGRNIDLDVSGKNGELCDIDENGNKVNENLDSSDETDKIHKSSSPKKSYTLQSPENPDNSDNPDNQNPPSRSFRDFKAIAEAFAKGRGISEKDYSKAIEMISSIGEGFVGEKIPLEVFELVHKGLDYDRAVSAAAEEGEIKGRNAAIEESLFPDTPDDGLPHFIASHADLKPRRNNSIFDLAREAGI